MVRCRLGRLNDLSEHLPDVTLQCRQVRLHRTLQLHGCLPSDFFATFSLVAARRASTCAVHEVERLHTLEHITEVLRDLQRHVAVGQDVQQRLVRHKVEAGEGLFLLLKVFVQGLLAHFDVPGDVQQCVLAGFCTTDLDDVVGLRHFHHQLLPGVVQQLEALGIVRQLAADVVALHEDRLQAAPIRLKLAPDVQHHIHCPQFFAPLINLSLAEFDDAGLRRHRHHFQRICI
mmetsp:Transcript_120678/g.385359  ORF Transcript_120678/g.385359 Transcript_120678/m.385359 type:complete len:231 (+) Transcript_120678:8804-9496(+)